MGVTEQVGLGPRDRTASFHQYPIPRTKSSVVNRYSSFNIISSTRGADDEDDEVMMLGAGSYRFQHRQSNTRTNDLVFSIEAMYESVHKQKTCSLQ